LGLNYVLDPKVQGTVTVQTSRPLSREALVPLLEEVLRVNGVALVRRDDFYEAVPLADAPGSSLIARPLIAPSAANPGYGLRIVPLVAISATEMAKIIDSVMPDGRIVRVDAARNLLILAGTQRELGTQQELIDLFDVDWLSGMSFAMVPLKSADAKSVADELETVFGDPQEGANAGLLRFVPIERLNAILVISPQAGPVDNAQAWIERLDRGGGEGGDRRLYVYYVQNGRAKDLAEVLSEAFGGARAERDAVPVSLPPGREPVSLTSLAPPAPAGDVIASGEQVEAAPDQPAPAAPPAAIIQPGTAPGQGIGVTDSGNIRIIADEHNNALLVLATPREYRMVEAALNKLDIVPLQVLIEATIAEVSLNNELRYGVQWFFKEGKSSITLSDFNTGAVAGLFPGFSYLLASGDDVRVALNALESVTDVKVISSPQLMVLDNQTAELQVGDEVPVATQSAVRVEDPGAPIVNSIQFRETGVILTVTPRVNAGGLVTLEIEQEVSDVVPTETSGIDSPTISQRKISSTVAIQSGQTVALGGLISDGTNYAKSGIPFLSRIPILGELFSSTEDTYDRTELLVLITPRVVANNEQARSVTDELRRKLRTVLPLGERLE